MTNAESKQGFKVFNRAGWNACLMGIVIGSNPYKTPQFSYWRSGYRAAELEAGGKTFSKIRKTYSLPELEDVGCLNCGDIYPEGVKCEKCI